jgi:hypothetical protein
LVQRCTPMRHPQGGFTYLTCDVTAEQSESTG